MFADLYQGATAFIAHKGVYKTDRGQYLHDRPILVESYADVTRIVDEARLGELLSFAKRMGRETNQAAVGLVINTVFHAITDFKDP